MAYPAAPWTLRGFAYQTLHLIDLDRARLVVPPEFELLSVFPGKTIGGVYLSRYESGSVLEYSELIVVAAIGRYGNQIGPLISHIYVDNPDSVAGGREIWGLPKQLAQFDWRSGERYVSVRQDERSLVTLDCGSPIRLWQQSLSGTSFGLKGAEVLRFSAEATLRLGLVGASLTIPASSPFAGLHLGQPWLTARAEALQLIVAGSETVGTRSESGTVESTQFAGGDLRA